MKRWVAWTFLGIPFVSSGAFERDLLSPASVALGGATAAHDAPLSLNPGAGEVSSWASVAYARPFRVEGLSEQSLRGGIRLSQIGFALDFGRFGNALYQEDTLACRLQWRYEGFSFGGRGVYYRRATEGFPTVGRLSPDFGFQVDASPTLRFGGHVRRLFIKRGVPPMETRLGARLLDENGALLMDVYRRGEEVGVAVGGEWASSSWVLWRFGVHNLPWQWAIGVEVKRAGFALQYTVETHPSLDASHHVGLTWVR